MNTLRFIDLFSGCGGFTLGMARAGFECLAAIDFNAEAVATLKANLPEVPHALQRDLTSFHPESLAALVGMKDVDVIVGGPPCQGFSTARQVDGANHGERLKSDPRRYLYREFLRYVDFFRPRLFVMENVLGIRSAASGAYFTAVQKEARELGHAQGRPGYRVHGQVEDAWELGVPQKRRRQIIIGVRADLPGYFVPRLMPVSRACARIVLGAAIGDLPILHAGGGKDNRSYDLKRRAGHLRRYGAAARDYLLKVLEIDRADELTKHVARPHSERDLRDFKRLREGESSAVAMRDRGVRFEFPYDKSTFKDRYTRQSRTRPCSTIVAHLSRDGLMFIHPTQNRSLTPREAARVQSFPDWYRFPVARTHAFRLIGNAVPPLVGEAVGIAVRSFLERIHMRYKAINFDLSPLPSDEVEAVNWILPLLDLDDRALRRAGDDDLKRAWYSIAFLYAGLHPDGASEHGTRVVHAREVYPEVSCIETRLLSPYYEQSGWPIVLTPLAKEARRRYENGHWKDHEFYCSDAQMAGMCFRNPQLIDEVGTELDHSERKWKVRVAT